MKLSELSNGRYFDGTYEWEKDGAEWTPLQAPMGMPMAPELSSLRKVEVSYVPLEEPGITTVANDELKELIRNETLYRLRTVAALALMRGKHREAMPEGFIEKEAERASAHILDAIGTDHGN